MKILLSIKPEYAERILNGEKRFEFRRAIFRNKNVTGVVIYATLPVGKVVGEFKIARVLQASPAKLWQATSHAAGISREYFTNYFRGRSRAYAIEISTYHRYARPKPLERVIPGATPPQSFCYVTGAA